MIIGFDTILFVRHDIDARGINMSQKRIESTIAFCKPTSLKELQSFMGIVNYFKDNLRDHSAEAKPFYEMVDLVTKQKTTMRYEKVKALVNSCPKLYFIDYQLPIILYTYASD